MYVLKDATCDTPSGVLSGPGSLEWRHGADSGYGGLAGFQFAPQRAISRPPKAVENMLQLAALPKPLDLARHSAQKKKRADTDCKWVKGGI